MKHELLFVFIIVFFFSCGIITNTTTPLDTSVLTGKIICIDPGHQENQNSELEPIAPNSALQKQKVSAGAVGIVTNTPEYVINLAIGLKLCNLLRAYNATVIMTRITNDVNISNIERAQIGNDAHGDIMIRIHADNSDNRLVQ
jgi:N-acetylmuramoyl-L-alanine amidase